MARGRMFDQAFVTSSKIRSVSRDDRLIYASILPFLDREGRHCAEPFVLMATIFRLTDFTIDEVVGGVARLNAVGLIDLYSDADNAAVLEYRRFLEFNKPNHREAKSRFASPNEGGPVRDELLIAALVEAHDRMPGGGPGGPPGGAASGGGAAERTREHGRVADERETTSSTMRNPPPGDAPGMPPGEAPGGPPYNGTERNGSSVPEHSPQSALPEGAPRPKGRGPAPAVAEYEARRTPREKTPAELELERFAKRAQA